MIIQCCVCKGILGEKEPLSNPATTHTFCLPCLKSDLQAQNPDLYAKMRDSGRFDYLEAKYGQGPVKERTA